MTQISFSTCLHHKTSPWSNFCNHYLRYGTCYYEVIDLNQGGVLNITLQEKKDLEEPCERNGLKALSAALTIGILPLIAWIGKGYHYSEITLSQRAIFLVRPRLSEAFEEKELTQTASWITEKVFPLLTFQKPLDELITTILTKTRYRIDKLTSRGSVLARRAKSIIQKNSNLPKFNPYAFLPQEQFIERKEFIFKHKQESLFFFTRCLLGSLALSSSGHSLPSFFQHIPLDEEMIWAPIFTKAKINRKLGNPFLRLAKKLTFESFIRRIDNKVTDSLEQNFCGNLNSYFLLALQLAHYLFDNDLLCEAASLMHKKQIIPQKSVDLLLLKIADIVINKRVHLIKGYIRNQSSSLPTDLELLVFSYFYAR